MSKRIFKFESSPIMQNKKYIITIDTQAFNMQSTTGSFNIIAARLMGLSYPQYLRMCRDVFGATIVGKNTNYPVAYFDMGDGLLALLNSLNKRANCVLSMKSCPQAEEKIIKYVETGDKWRENDESNNSES